jgi:hypothetical protein
VNVHTSELVTCGKVRRSNFDSEFVLIGGSKKVSRSLQTLDISDGDILSYASNTTEDDGVGRVEIACSLKAFDGSLDLASLEFHSS